MANLKQLTLAGAAMDVPAALNDLSDVSAPSPVTGQVLTYGNGGIWQPQAFQAAGFPGLDALDWKTAVEAGITLTGIASDSNAKFAVFQNQAFAQFTECRLTGASPTPTTTWYEILNFRPGNALCPPVYRQFCLGAQLTANVNPPVPTVVACGGLPVGASGWTSFYFWVKPTQTLSSGTVTLSGLFMYLL